MTTERADLLGDFNLPLTLIYGRATAGKSLFASALARAASDQKQLVAVLGEENAAAYRGMHVVVLPAGLERSVHQQGLEEFCLLLKRMRTDLLVVDERMSPEAFNQLLLLLKALPTMRCIVTLEVKTLQDQLPFIARLLPERNSLKMVRVDVSQVPAVMVAVARGQEIEFEPYPVWFDREARAIRVDANPDSPAAPD